MEKKDNILEQAWRFMQSQQKHRRWLRAMTAMAAVVVFVTTYLLILPAITMENSVLEVTATPSEAVLGEVIETEIFASADDGRKETYFVLTADGDNAGLDESQLDFDSDGIASIEDENEQVIDLHREYTKTGEARYWFVLQEGQSASFSLPWVNGMDRYRAEEIVEEIPVEPEEPPVEEEIPPTEDTSEGETLPDDTSTEESIPPESDTESENTDGEIPSTEMEKPETDVPPQDEPDVDVPDTDTPDTEIGEPDTDSIETVPEAPPAEKSYEESQEPESPAVQRNVSPLMEDTGNQESTQESDFQATGSNVSYEEDNLFRILYASIGSMRTVSAATISSSANNESPLTASPVTATDSDADKLSGEPGSQESTESEPVEPDGGDETPLSDNGDSFDGDPESETIYDIDIVLDREGDPEREGAATITFGCGQNLEVAANTDGQYVFLSWLPEQPEPEYICGKEEHLHDENCYDPDGNLICTREEHQHTEECLHPHSAEVYQYEDDFISVTATPEYENVLPPGTQFRVTQVTADTDGYQYDAYIQALENLNNAEKQMTNPKEILLYDIAFLVEQPPETEGAEPQLVEFQPTEGSVQIQFAFKQPQTLDLSEENSPDYQVLHLPLVSEVREQVNTTAEATGITAGDVLVEEVEADVSNGLVEFTLGSFSLVAFVTHEDGSVVPITEVTPGLDYNYRDVLGSAINYGITANEVHKVAHMDTTFAASHVTSDGGNITVGAYTGSQGSPLLIGSITGSLSIDGQTNTVYTTEEAAKSITLQGGSNFQYRTEKEITDQIAAMLSHAKQVSHIMAAQRTYSVMKYGTYWDGQQNVEGWYVDQNEKEIDLSNLPDGTYYIDGDTFLDKNDVKIRKNPGQTVVFNLKSEAVNLKRFEVVDSQTGQSMNSANSNGDIYPYASTVIFNMPNAKTVNIESGIFGVLIAPNATVNIGSTSSGWIVADTVTNPGGEWHFVYQDLTKPLPVTVAARKTLDGEAPDEQTEFSFKVERWDDDTNGWVEEETVQNFLGDILFRETFSQTGTYYYRVSEINGGGAYQYDTTQYIVEINVTAIQENILQAEQTFYETGDKEQLNDGTKTTEILFQNTTGEPGYVLPETGGPGTNLFTAGGLALLAAVGLMYIKQHRRRDESL
ncbi:MAG: choice-of-anchor A family protein [Clostridiales bacterium]|nr:choice-of-anchor A family protein [Clostridiales bacterium]